jgi:threonine/homoserine/homoserine lactone efflux protein
MSKALAIIGMLIAFLILLVFALDMAVGMPFSKASPVMDICMIVGAAVLAYLGWSAYREQA